ncbi:hypothetical protein IFR09_06335 [Pseudomonas syringae]|nr:hypothetical protein [Pseudomonas syringae]MBD8573297.1 hypothetical protein [Pseudomonas syringae]MBD8789350.1 hypothetical protein [Pseudomonas syringae]MBD8800226.1 hypothetical protein [Pseudomonas syringae]MBD8810778.1 hypothetical protein [Pseudomonas syringae]
MDRDDAIYQALGDILLAIVPRQARVAYLDAWVSYEADHARLHFNYLDKHGELQVFMSPNGRIDHDILVLLARLREFFMVNGLYAGGRPWSGCQVSLPLDSARVSVEFKYD